MKPSSLTEIKNVLITIIIYPVCYYFLLFFSIFIVSSYCSRGGSDGCGIAGLVFIPIWILLSIISTLIIFIYLAKKIHKSYGSALIVSTLSVLITIITFAPILGNFIIPIFKSFYYR